MKNLNENSRKAFEDWCEAESMPFEVSTMFNRDENGEYKDDQIQTKWIAWQAGVEFIKRNLGEK